MTAKAASARVAVDDPKIQTERRCCAISKYPQANEEYVPAGHLYRQANEEYVPVGNLYRQADEEYVPVGNLYRQANEEHVQAIRNLNG